MGSTKPWITSTLQSWYDDGYDLACKFREEGLIEHPDAINTQQWFERRLDELAYEQWLNWEPYYEDVSDEYFNSLTPDAKKKFRDRELRRWRTGLWERVKAFDVLSNQAKADYRKRYNDRPYLGGVQLLTPTHYVMMNYIKVDIKGRGITSPFYFRRAALFWDLTDILTYYTPREVVKFSFEDRDMLLVFKTRGAHFSTSLISQDVKNLLTEQSYSAGLAIDKDSKIQQYLRKTIKAFDTMPEWIKPLSPDGKKLYGTTHSKDNARIWVRFFDPDTKSITPWTNEILVRGHMPSSWEDLRLDRFSVDEAGVSNQYDIIDLIDKGSACMRNERGERVGLITIGGTSDANNERNNPTFNRIKDNPKAYNAHLMFFGAQHIKGHNPATGWTPESDILENIYKQREEIRATGDLKKLTSITIIDPLTIQDCLYVKNSIHIDVERCQAQLNKLEARIQGREQPPLSIQRGWFRAPTEQTIHNPIWMPDSNGGWHILRHPRRESFKNIGQRPDFQFFASSDNADKLLDESTVAQLNAGETLPFSRQSVVIFDVNTNEPVAFYLWRHKSTRDDYKQSLLGCMYYNCYFFPETNKPGNLNYFMEYTQPDGRITTKFMKWLYPTPLLYSGNWDTATSPRTTKYGLYTTSNKIKIYEEELIPYMDNYTELIQFPEILRTFMHWDVASKKSPPDLGMAFIIGLAGLHDFQSRIMPRQSGAVRRLNVQELYDIINK